MFAGLWAAIDPSKAINLHSTRSATERRGGADLIGAAVAGTPENLYGFTDSNSGDALVILVGDWTDVIPRNASNMRVTYPAWPDRVKPVSNVNFLSTDPLVVDSCDSGNLHTEGGTIIRVQNIGGGASASRDIVSIGFEDGSQPVGLPLDALRWFPFSCHPGFTTIPHKYVQQPRALGFRFSTDGTFRFYTHHSGHHISALADDWTDTKLYYDDATDETIAAGTTIKNTAATLVVGGGCPAIPTILGSAGFSGSGATGGSAALIRAELLDTGAAVLLGADFTADCNFGTGTFYLADV